MCLKMATFLFFEWLCQKLTDFNVFWLREIKNDHFLDTVWLILLLQSTYHQRWLKVESRKSYSKTKKLAIFEARCRNVKQRPDCITIPAEYAISYLDVTAIRHTSHPHMLSRKHINMYTKKNCTIKFNTNTL